MLITSKGKVLHYLIYIITFICLNPNIFGKSKLANKNQEKQYVNRLAKESSPYLLQHKNNPVDWYPWGDEAFQKATELNRPIFYLLVIQLVIGAMLWKTNLSKMNK